MSKIGIFGGTFNPIHNGHMALCKACIEQYALDKLLLIPTNIPPHKQPPNLASGKDRLAMASLAAQEYEKIGDFIIKASDIELKLGEKSYTIYTLEALKKEYPNDEFFLIIGSDMLLTFSQWFRYLDILKLATVIAGGRFIGENEQMLKEQKRLNEIAVQIQTQNKVLLVELPTTVLSSTDIRAKIKANENVNNLLPKAVFNYIIANNLYK